MGLRRESLRAVCDCRACTSRAQRSAYSAVRVPYSSAEAKRCPVPGAPRRPPGSAGRTAHTRDVDKNMHASAASRDKESSHNMPPPICVWPRAMRHEGKE